MIVRWRHARRAAPGAGMAALLVLAACAGAPAPDEATTGVSAVSETAGGEAAPAPAGGRPPAEARAAAVADPTQAQDVPQTARPRPDRESVTPLEPTPGPRGLRVTLGDGLFPPNSATLRPDAGASLRSLATLLGRYPERRVLIEGHTDDVGPAVHNLHLSLLRAGAVKERLVSEGVAGRRLIVRGQGEREPIASNDSQEGRRRNRRVEVIILDPDEAATVAAPSAAGGPTGDEPGPRPSRPDLPPDQ